MFISNLHLGYSKDDPEAATINSSATKENHKVLSTVSIHISEECLSMDQTKTVCLTTAATTQRKGAMLYETLHHDKIPNYETGRGCSQGA